MSERRFLDLQCGECGTIYLDIPPDAEEGTTVHCSNCQKKLGTWGDMQDQFNAATYNGTGSYELKDGRIREN